MDNYEGYNDRKPKKFGISKDYYTSSSSISLTSEGKELLLKLKEVRKRIAKEEKMPAYIIFGDKSLMQMCVYRPKTFTQMMGISFRNHLEMASQKPLMDSTL
jgi:ATP-dependent DNA helicase RecQ